MEKLSVVVAAVLMMLSFSMVGLAYHQNTVGTTGTNYQTKMGHEAMCGPGEMYAGAVVWVDPDTQRMMVNGRDGSKIFDVSGAVIKGMPETDHFVTVEYTVANGERLASSVNMIPKRVASLYVGTY